MTRRLHALGGWAAAHPWRTAGVWLLALAVAFGLVAGFGGTPHDDYDVPGMPAQAGTDLLREQFPAASGAADRVVVHDRDGDAVDPATVEALRERLADMPHVSGVAPARTSDDGATVLLDVRYDVPVTDPDLMGELGALEAAVAPTEDGRPAGRARRRRPRQRRPRGRRHRRARRHHRRAGAARPHLRVGARRRHPDPRRVCSASASARPASCCSPPSPTSAPRRRPSRRWSGSASASTTRCCSSAATSSCCRAGTTSAPPLPGPPPRPAARSSSPPRRCSSRSWACAWRACRRTRRSASRPRSRWSPSRPPR